MRPPRPERALWPSLRRPTARATSSCASRAGISAYASRTAEHGSTAPPSACPDSGLRELDEPAVRIPEVRGSTPRVVPRLDEEAEPVRHQRSARLVEIIDDDREVILVRRAVVQCASALVDEQLPVADRKDRSARPVGDRRERRSGHGRTPTLPSTSSVKSAISPRLLMSRSRTPAVRRSATS